MRIELQIYTDDATPEELHHVYELIKLENVRRTAERAKWESVDADEAPPVNSSQAIATILAPTQPLVAPVAPTAPAATEEAPAKKKRKRRTKAEIAADALLDGANTPTESPAAPQPTVAAETTTVPAPVEEATPPVAPVAPVAPVPVAPVAVAPAVVQSGEEQLGLPHLREAITNAVKRLTDQGNTTPTVPVVEVIKTITGKASASEIDPSQFGAVIAQIRTLGV